MTLNTASTRFSGYGKKAARLFSVISQCQHIASSWWSSWSTGSLMNQASTLCLFGVFVCFVFSTLVFQSTFVFWGPTRTANVKDHLEVTSEDGRLKMIWNYVSILIVRFCLLICGRWCVCVKTHSCLLLSPCWFQGWNSAPHVVARAFTSSAISPVQILYFPMAPFIIEMEWTFFTWSVRAKSLSECANSHGASADPCREAVMELVLCTS